MSPVGEAALLDRVRDKGYPAVGNSASGFGIAEGESAWVLAIPRLSEAQGREVARLLDEIEARAVREAEEDERREAARHAEAVLRGEAQPTDEEAALAGQARIEAEADRQRYVAERPARMEALLERIARAVEGGRS